MITKKRLRELLKDYKSEYARLEEAQEDAETNMEAVLYRNLKMSALGRVCMLEELLDEFFGDKS
jgi:hypothetical protein